LSAVRANRLDKVALLSPSVFDGPVGYPLLHIYD